MLDKPVVMPFLGDAVLVVEPGMTGATGNIYCGLHEFEDMALVLHFLRPSDFFVDIGANVGSYSVLAGKVAEARGIAIEPVPDTFAKLERNLSINSLTKSVLAYQCALGRTKGMLRFTSDLDTTNRVAERDYGGSVVEVPSNTLDELLAGQPCHLWKIDVEGFEREVLAGATVSLRKPELDVVLLEANDAELERTMNDAGFTRCAYEPFSRRLARAESSFFRQNNLWVKDFSAVQSRCESASKRRVLGIEF